MGWDSTPQGCFEVKALPSGLLQVNGTPVEMIAVNEGDQSLLIAELERQAQLRKAEAVYLSDPGSRELPCVLGGAQSPRRQWYCYAAFIVPQGVPRPPSIVQLDAPAIGFRAFNWGGGPLLAVGVHTEWPIRRGPQIAECKSNINLWASSGRPHEEPAPLEYCTCGIHAHAKPEQIARGSIQAVVIGYGRIFVHPDGWRAEKCEIIGLVAPKKCVVHEWLTGTTVCRRCGITAQHEFVGLYQSPSLSALEILAEQYGARVIDSWDSGILLAEEQGARLIPQKVHDEAAVKSEAVLKGRGTHGSMEGGYFVPPTWIMNGFTGETITETTYQLITTVDPPKKRGIGGLKLKRQKRELYARFWKHGHKAA